MRIRTPSFDNRRSALRTAGNGNQIFEQVALSTCELVKVEVARRCSVQSPFRQTVAERLLPIGERADC